ncbi:N-acetyltransferase [Patiriisocius marinistellae]|uniref:N-acetyltransferase n=1 Tax=Patiriisocius marinistellae TaxID=2494560 RepID=A0A5J4FZ43_9FLAO|nr:GNAT family N-acetyltransferase [Patiriisocius marinistellae]GEQ84951.1 N-acetyltransferase [Patiriisocius marinistellae]
MIRKAKPSEIVQVMAITRACAVKMIENKIYQWNDEYPNIKAFEKDVSSGELYVLTISKTIIGCITISEEKDIEYNDIEWNTKDSKHYYIHRVAIHPDFQHQGYAKRLMDFAEMLAIQNNVSSIRLDTFSQNLRNQKFYLARGYLKTGEIYFPRQSEFSFYCYELIIT